MAADNTYRYFTLNQRFSSIEQNKFSPRKKYGTKENCWKNAEEWERSRAQTRNLVYPCIRSCIIISSGSKNMAAAAHCRCSMVAKISCFSGASVCVRVRVHRHIVGWWSLPCQRDVVVQRSQFNRNVSHIPFYTIRFSIERKKAKNSMEHGRGERTARKKGKMESVFVWKLR